MTGSPRGGDERATLRARLRLAANLLFLLPMACRPYTYTPPPAPATARYPDAVACPLPGGTVRGRVVWADRRPTVPPVPGLIDTPDGPEWGDAPNPFAPRIDDTGGLADAVVWLTPTDPAKLKPWPHPPLRVELADRRITAVQPGGSGRVGFVKLGDEVEMGSKGKEFHLLRARGAAFFTLPFPAPGVTQTRRFDVPGVVEFTSAAGYFWTAADVVVCEHPYYAATDAAGRFELANVPPGEYELVARVRNWAITGRDRDPETGKLARLYFADPWVVRQRVTVTDGPPAEVEVRVK